MEHGDQMTHPHDGSTENLQAQLAALYAERELLRNELGVADAADVVALVRRHEARGESALSQRVAAHDADRELLARELGTSDAHEIVSSYRALERRFTGLTGALRGVIALVQDA